MVVAGDVAATPRNHTPKSNGKVSPSFTDPNATNHLPANAADSTVDHSSANIKITSMALDAEDYAALTPLTNIMPNRSLTYAESLLHAGQISQEQFDVLTAHIKNDMTAIGREHPLTFDFAGNVNISHSLKHREVEAVGTVFNIAELLESILMLLSVEDLILRAPLVCKGFRDALQSSQNLLRKTYALASPDAGESFEDFAFFPFSIGAIPIEPFSRELELWIRLNEMRLPIDDDYTGLRARQICCPAVKSMRFERGLLVNDLKEVEYLHDFEDYCIMRKHEGITFGDIFDVLKRMDPHVSGVYFDLHPDITWDGKLT